MRTRRIVKWGGLAACVLIAVAWGVSTFRDTVFFRGHGVSASLMSGAMCVYVTNAADSLTVQRASLYWLPYYMKHVGQLGGPLGWVHEVIVPLWIPLLIVGTQTVVLWRRDRVPRGHCPCGYNLMGNVSGRCPECGEVL